MSVHNSNIKLKVFKNDLNIYFFILIFFLNATILVLSCQCGFTSVGWHIVMCGVMCMSVL